MDELNEIAKVPATADEVQRRYRYQYNYTILLAIQMYQGSVPYEKLFCELAEDVMAVLPSKKFVGIQIKTKEQKGTLFSVNDDAVVDSLKHFVELDEQFPNVFEAFVFVSNTDFKKGSDLQELLSSVQNKNLTLTKEQNILIKKLMEKCNVVQSKIIDVLRKTTFQKGPSIDDIESKIIHEHLSKIPHCSGFTVPQHESVLKQLMQNTFDKSSKTIKNSIAQYVAFVKDGKKKQLQQELESKEFTRDLVEQITKSVNSAYLTSSISTPFTLKEGSMERMREKMVLGDIPEMEINSMKDLSYSAQVYFFEEYNKRNGQAEEVKKQMDHLQTLVTNQAAESQTDTRQDDKKYGTEMLRSIEGRLNDIIQRRHEDVFFIKYEILKGIVGILTSDCRVWFSNNTKEDLN